MADPEPYQEMVRWLTVQVSTVQLLPVSLGNVVNLVVAHILMPCFKTTFIIVPQQQVCLIV